MVEKTIQKFGASEVFTFPCPAKLNLFLYINGRREDGYHELQTLFQFLDFGDDLSISLREDGKIQLTPAMPDIPLESNLIYRAAKLLQQKTQTKFGANLHLNKRLPMGGGVGGGSSDAATTLVALNLLWQTGLSLEELAQLGLQLGADVPIFVHGKSAFAEGVGEKLQFCEPLEKWYVVLKPKVSISTAVVFQHPDLPRNTPKRSMIECLSRDYENDCEKIVKNHYSEVEEMLNWLIQYAPARLTGTGACVFAEFDTQKSAELVFQTKPKSYDGFVAQGQNLSPLHQLINQLKQQRNLL